MNIILTGFMGTGKSIVSRKLAKRLGMSYLDTDELIEKREGIKISAIFQEKGEEYFRQLETQAIKEVASLDNHVISSGGGVVLREENVTALKKNGFIICLSANPEVILQRTANNRNRPLLEVDDQKKRIKELLKIRKPFYDKADFNIDTSSLSSEEVVEKIVARCSSLVTRDPSLRRTGS